MGALRGSIGYSKLHVRGDLPDRFADRFVEAIRLRAFRPLTPSDEDDERVGWVSIHHPFDTDLDHGKLFANEYLNLGLRIDRYRIPGAILKAHLAEAEAARLEESGQSRLSKTQREDVKAMVVRRLREQFLPAMRVVDVSFNVQTKVVRFFSHSTKMQETLIELFESTFKLTLVQDGAYVRAENLGLSSGLLDAVASVEPELFHVERPR